METYDNLEIAEERDQAASLFEGVSRNLAKVLASRGMSPVQRARLRSVAGVCDEAATSYRSLATVARELHSLEMGSFHAERIG